MPPVLPERLIWVDAHEWAQTLPLNINTLICLCCGLKKGMSEKSSQRCNPHVETLESGWTDMTTGKHFANGQLWEPPGG